MASGSPLDGRLIGFGCMPFEIALNRPDTEWAAAVKKALGEIATVSHLKIEVAEKMLSGEAALEDGAELPTLPDDNERPWFWPEPDFTSVTFDLNVPLRMQPELGMFRTAGAEQFRVRTVYGFHGPVTFVSVLDSDDPSTASASTAVGIVHRFLSKELERQGGDVRMARVGPSPFHADAQLIPGPSGQAEPLVYDRLGRTGYDRIRFSYNTTDFTTLEDAEDALQWSLRHELELFYYMRRLSYILRDEVRELQISTRKLVEKHSLTGVKGWFTRLFSTASEARKLGLVAIDMQARSAQQASAFAEWMRDTYAQSDVLGVFEDAIREIAQESDAALVVNTSEIVRFVEAGRRSEFEVLMLSAATLLGGLAGGVVGLLVAAGGGA